MTHLKFLSHVIASFLLLMKLQSVLQPAGMATASPTYPNTSGQPSLQRNHGRAWSHAWELRWKCLFCESVLI